MTCQNYPVGLVPSPLPENECYQFPPALNPLSNHIDYEMPRANRRLPSEETFLFHISSRDVSRGGEAEGLLDIYATTASSDGGNAFTNLGGTVLSFPDDGTSYNWEASGFESWLFAGSDDQQTHFQSDFPEHPGFYSADGQWYLDAEFGAQSVPLQQGEVIVTTADDIPNESSQNIGISATVPESPSHCQFKIRGEIVCNECSLHFPHNSALNTHAKQTQHAPYACTCGVTFSRVDIMNRHVEKHNPKASYPCPHCSKYSGTKAFTRRDHLTQHLRGYHNIEVSSDSDNPQSSSSRKTALACPHRNCSYHHDTARSSSSPNPRIYFRTKKDFTKHLREVHDESLYPCDAPDCGRVGGRGFFRKRDLSKHQRDHHEDSKSTYQMS